MLIYFLFAIYKSSQSYWVATRSNCNRFPEMYCYHSISKICSWDMSYHFEVSSTGFVPFSLGLWVRALVTAWLPLDGNLVLIMLLETLWCICIQPHSFTRLSNMLSHQMIMLVEEEHTRRLKNFSCQHSLRSYHYMQGSSQLFPAFASSNFTYNSNTLGCAFSKVTESHSCILKGSGYFK